MQATGEQLARPLGAAHGEGGHTGSGVGEFWGIRGRGSGLAGGGTS